MTSPFGHHFHHHRDEDDDDNRNPPPYGPPSYPPPPPNYQPSFDGGPHSYTPPPPPQPQPPFSGGGDYYPPPPQVYHTSHSSHYDPPPPPPPVIHHHHEEEHRFRPHMPSFIQNHFPGMGHEAGPGYRPGPGPELGELASKPTCRIYCKAGGERFAVAIRDDKVVLTYADSNDPTQHWIKDEKFSTRVKDSDGYPSFALVNRSTMHALKHSISAHPVQLTHYKRDIFDGSVLWTESKDCGHGYRMIRMVNNIKLVLDAFNGDKDHGGVHDGTIVALYESWKGDNQNQQWKLIPY